MLKGEGSLDSLKLMVQELVSMREHIARSIPMARQKYTEP